MLLASDCRAFPASCRSASIVGPASTLLVAGDTCLCAQYAATPALPTSTYHHKYGPIPCTLGRYSHFIEFSAKQVAVLPVAVSTSAAVADGTRFWIMHVVARQGSM